MLKAMGRISVPSLAYLLLLLVFASLGVFVAALAAGSGVAALLGLFLVLCLVGSVAGFRAGARRLAQSTAMTEPGSAVSIFATPLRQDQIDRYLSNYRGQGTKPTMTVIKGERQPVSVESAVPKGLSA